ncbi:MAG: DUF3786 domain-containing protein [Candidatus Omnitrophota bacterium]
MGYAQALDKAWEGVRALMGDKRSSVRFISDTYDIDPASKRAVSASNNSAAKDHVAIILLHYLYRKLTIGRLPELTGEWVGFDSLEGGEGYLPAFRKRTISRIVQRYGSRPEELYDAGSGMSAERGAFKDVSIIVHPFDEVAILIKISKADPEFPPDAGVLFDKNISAIFCTEDIVVLTEMIVHQL